LAGSNGDSVDGIGSEAQLNSGVSAMSGDSTGAIYVSYANGVRRIGTDNKTTLVAGSELSINFCSTLAACGLGYIDGPAATARFNIVTGLASSAAGVLFVSDNGNNVIRRIDSGGNVTTYAGVAGQNARVDGPIATARFQLLLDAPWDRTAQSTSSIHRQTPAASSARSHPMGPACPRSDKAAK